MPTEPNPHTVLDEKKRQRAIKVLEHIDLPEIRAVSLATLARWKKQGAWCSAYDEWETLMREGSDNEVIAAMTSQDEETNRLRQSSPYVALYKVTEPKRWEELTRPVGEVLSPEGIQYGEVSDGTALWDRRSRDLRAAIERELGDYLSGPKVLLYEGAWGEVYMGKVIGLSESFVVQEIFCHSVFAHLRQDIELYGPIEIGQYLKVRYGNHSAELIE